MRRLSRSLSLGLSTALIVGSLTALTLAPAHAASGPMSVSGSSSAAVPNTNIVGTKAVFKPKHLKVHLTPSGSCTTATEGMSVNNETKASQTVTYNGAPFFTLAAEGSGGICFFVAGTYKFSLSSNTAGRPDCGSCIS